MAEPNRYSRLVAVSKVTLPLLALALLSSLFLLARSPGQDGAGVRSGDGIGDLARDPQVQNPVYRSVTDDARPVTVVAERAVPRSRENRVVDLTEPDARLRGPDEGETTLRARAGEIDRSAETGRFAGAVRVETPEGYVLETDLLQSDLAGMNATSPGPVQITGPGLTLEAGAMEVRARDGAPARAAVFTGGVRVVYQPQTAEDAP